MCEQCRLKYNSIPSELTDAAQEISILLSKKVNMLMESIPLSIINNVGNFDDMTDDEIKEMIGFVPDSADIQRWRRMYIAHMVASMAATTISPFISHNNDDMALQVGHTAVNAYTINQAANRGVEFGQLKHKIEQMNKTAH